MSHPIESHGRGAPLYGLWKTSPASGGPASWLWREEKVPFWNATGAVVLCKEPRWHSIPKGGWDILFPSFGMGALEDVSEKPWDGNPHSLCVSLALRNGCPHPDLHNAKSSPKGVSSPWPPGRGSGNRVASEIKQTMPWMSSVMPVSTCHPQ